MESIDIIDGLKLFSVVENEIVRVLFFSHNALSAKEIRNRLATERARVFSAPAQTVKLVKVGDTYKQVETKPDTPEDIERRRYLLDSRDGLKRIPAFGTILNAAQVLVQNGFLVWRPSGNAKTTKGLFALNPRFFQQLKTAGYAKVRPQP